MPSIVRALAAVRARRRRIQVAAGAVGLVGLGIAGALLLARPAAEDPCARGLEPYAHAFDAKHREAVSAALVSDPSVQKTVLQSLDFVSSHLRSTYTATCHADRTPIQPATTAACLEARRIELVGFVDDVIADGPKWALTLGGVMSDPERCTNPPQGLLTSHVPEDPALRRKVTAIRYRGFELEAARDRAEFAHALPLEAALVEDAAKVWPLVHGETMYLLGTTQAQGGDNKQAIETMREAAVIAERAHDDHTAANVWMQLAMSATFDEGAPERGLEYVRYAEATLDRLGRPSEMMAMFDYIKGSTLVELKRHGEAETVLEESIELSEKYNPSTLANAIQGLGYLYESQGRYEDAVGAYRKALATLRPDDKGGAVSSAIVFRSRLAQNLTLLGKNDEAEALAREAVALSDKALGDATLDGPTTHVSLAQVLLGVGKPKEALPEIEAALERIKKLVGERNERYGEVLQLEAAILSELDRNGEALRNLDRACDVIAFTTGEDTSTYAECLQQKVSVLFALARSREALPLAEHVLDVFTKVYGDKHPAVARMHTTRGALRFELGQHAAAVADLELAIAQLQTFTLDAGNLGEAELYLAKELWRSDPKRARTLIDDALARLANPGWAHQHADAAEWLASNGHPRTH